MTAHDLTGDGRADLVATSPWGLGVLGLGAGGFVGHTLAKNGTRLGGWILDTGVNTIEVVADLDGDGRAELLVSSPWGVGVLGMVGGSLTSKTLMANGQRAGGWIVDTTNNRFHRAGDIDGDGRVEVVVTSPWGLGVLEMTGATLGTLMLAPNGTRLEGGWLLNSGDNDVVAVADLDGDGRAEVVLQSPWGLGVLRFDGGTFHAVVMAPNGTDLGGWTLDAGDRVEVAADLLGVGRAQLLVRSAHGIALLALDGSGLRAAARAAHGDDLGGWTLDCLSDRMGVAGDVDGDRCAEVLLTGTDGVALLEAGEGRFWCLWTARTGTRLGQWLLNTRDNRLNRMVDVDGDGRAEVVVSSPWGLGVLGWTGRELTSRALVPNGTRLGQWLLNTRDNDLEAGTQSHGLIIWHPDWTGAVMNTQAFLRNRGYAVTATADVTEGLVQLERLSRTVGPGDPVFLYIAGHGGTWRSMTDTSTDSAGLHILQFGDGSIVRYSQMIPAFRRIAAGGADLTIFNGACDAGESVVDAIGQRYLALSTTSVHAPAITNTPDPSDLMRRVGRPNSFGLWWSDEKTASLMDAQVPARFYQKVYRSDDTPISRLSLFYKPAITVYQSVGGSWDLMVRHCYLLQHVYPTVWAGLSAEERAASTVDCEAYLAAERQVRTDVEPRVDALRALLSDASVVARAADVYAARYPVPWQALFGDLSWNVDAEPVRRSRQSTPVEPRQYAGRDGFRRMVAEILSTLTLFAQSYDEQERLLRQLDGELKRRRLVRVSLVDTVPVLPRPTPTDYLRFNRVDLAQRQVLLRSVTAGSLPAAQLHTKLERGLPQTSLVFTDLFHDELDDFARHHAAIVNALHPSVKEIVSRLLAVQATDAVLLDRLFFLLTIVEEAMSRASATGAETGDLLSF